jgi:hypothetical protein
MGVEAGALGFDSESTAQGLAIGRCEEGNSWLGPHPSNGKIATFGVIELGIVATLGALATRHHLRWFTPALIAMPAMEHIKGGVSWRTTCWN